MQPSEATTPHDEPPSAASEDPEGGSRRAERVPASLWLAALLTGAAIEVILVLWKELDPPEAGESPLVRWMRAQADHPLRCGLAWSLAVLGIQLALRTHGYASPRESRASHLNSGDLG